MDYKEALKKVQAKKPKQNFMLIEISYDRKLVLPYQEGIAFMASLENAEQLIDSYSKPKGITGIDRDQIKTSLMSYAEFEQVKIAALLNVSIEEVKHLELTAT